ncbi:type 2 periplasmic-binding domain-containing protein [Paraburkholderia caballeronis]|uniref:hypothetical protein n=1 Tax=Paraburkholderia caballeronis TaxID=416943 RepID=UPI000B83914A
MAFLPDYAIDEWLADYRLLVVLPGAEESSGYFRTMWPSATHVTPRLRRVIDFMTDGCSTTDSRTKAQR